MKKSKLLVALLCVTGSGILAFGLSQSSATGGDQTKSAAQAIVDKYTVPNPPREGPPVNAADPANGKPPVSVSDTASRELCDARKAESAGHYGAKDAEVRWAGKMNAAQNRDWIRGYSGGSLAPDLGNVNPDAVFTLCIFTGHFYNAAPPVYKPMGTVIEMAFYFAEDGTMSIGGMTMEQSAWKNIPTPEEVSAAGLQDPPRAPPFPGPTANLPPK